MDGVYVEKQITSGSELWIVRDVNTRVALSVGSTINQAVQNYEIAVENERIAKELGVSLDDFEI